MYAGTRQPLAHPGRRVTALTLDVTSTAQIQQAAREAGSLNVLINNAGIALYDDLSDRPWSNGTSPSTCSAPTA